MQAARENAIMSALNKTSISTSFFKNNNEPNLKKQKSSKFTTISPSNKGTTALPALSKKKFKIPKKKKNLLLQERHEFHTKSQTSQPVKEEINEED